MASEDVQTNLRLPGDLKDRLVATASDNRRSLSAEVAARLEASFRSGSTPMNARVLSATRDLADLAGITEEDALERLVLQGYATLNNRNVLVVRADANATTDDLIRVIKAAQNFLPNIADVHFEKDQPSAIKP